MEILSNEIKRFFMETQQMKPVRVQRKRTKGWKMPENTVAVARPSFWGNPFKIGEWHKIGKGAGHSGFTRLTCWEQKHATEGFEFCDSNTKAVELYERWITRYPKKEIKELSGKNLACWCRLDEPCHADILLKIANEDKW